MAKVKYGEMPEQPDNMKFAQVKGDAGIYEVRAIDWVGCKVNIYRALDWEWHDISKIAFVEPEQPSDNGASE